MSAVPSVSTSVSTDHYTAGRISISTQSILALHTLRSRYVPSVSTKQCTAGRISTVFKVFWPCGHKVLYFGPAVNQYQSIQSILALRSPRLLPSRMLLQKKPKRRTNEAMKKEREKMRVRSPPHHQHQNPAGVAVRGLSPHPSLFLALLVVVVFIGTRI